MGAKIILFVLIAVVCSSLASAIAQTRIEFVSAVCDDSGNINAVFKQGSPAGEEGIFLHGQMRTVR